MNTFNFINNRCISKIPELDVLELKASKLNQWKYLKASEPELYVKNLTNHFGCVNAIEFSQNGNIIVSGGDDKRVLVWNMATCLSGKNPRSNQMNMRHESNIFCVAIANGSDYVYSAGNDCCVIRHDIISGKCASFYKYGNVIYCMSVQPDNCHILASACENKRAIIQDVRLSNLSSTVAIELIMDLFPMHGVDFNPLDTQYVATANSFAGAQLWDIRYPKKWLLNYESVAYHHEYEADPIIMSNNEDWRVYESQEDRRKLSAMSVAFDDLGQNLLVLRRRGFPILYGTGTPKPKRVFIDSCQSNGHSALINVGGDGKTRAQGYFNSCTMKSGCFAGCKNEYVVSGSDDFNLYLWKIVEESEDLFVRDVHTKLAGHHSIPNQVRFDPNSGCLISSGVEKIIKMWSGLPVLPRADSGLHAARRDFNLQGYLDVMLSHDFPSLGEEDEETLEEDVRMIAFFDSLIDQDQRRHRDRGQDRAFFDIYEDYDPMMDSDSDTSSLNLGTSRYISSLNHSRSTSQSEASIPNQSASSNSSISGHSSPTSPFDPELDNECLSSCDEDADNSRIETTATLSIFRNPFDDEMNQDIAPGRLQNSEVRLLANNHDGCNKSDETILDNDLATMQRIGCCVMDEWTALTSISNLLQNIESDEILNSSEDVASIAGDEVIDDGDDKRESLTDSINCKLLYTSESGRIVDEDGSTAVDFLMRRVSNSPTNVSGGSGSNLSVNKSSDFLVKGGDTSCDNNICDSKGFNLFLPKLLGRKLNNKRTNDSLEAVMKLHVSKGDDQIVNKRFSDSVFKKIAKKNRQYRS